MLSGDTHLLSFAQRQFVLILSGEVVQHNGVYALLSARGWRGLVDVDGRGRVARTVGERVLLGAVAREGVLGRRTGRGTTEGTGRRLTRARGGTTLLHLFVGLLGTTRTRTLARSRGGGGRREIGVYSEEGREEQPDKEKGATSGSMGMPSLGEVDLNLDMFLARALKKSFWTERSVWNS